MPHALVTGAGKGIGRAIALHLASQGIHVFINARSVNDLRAVQSEIKDIYGMESSVLVGDVSQKEVCNEICHEIKEKTNTLELLVNNAGRFVMDSLINGNEDLVEELFKTNTLSAYYLSKGLFSLLKESEKGHIFNICSIAGLDAYPNSGAYSISKFAMLGLSKSLRMELQDTGVRVTAIHPGATYTASWEGVELPQDRFIKASEIAEVLWAAYQLSSSANVDELLIRPTKGDIG